MSALGSSWVSYSSPLLKIQTVISARPACHRKANASQLESQACNEADRKEVDGNKEHIKTAEQINK